MNDFEDYTTVFFQECDELLDDLEERLGALTDGDADPEVVHAAFRAVHSIKGGADAFGFRALVTFAHVFEATMDAIRGDRLAAGAEVCEVLVRARDVLCDLVEQARQGDTEPLPSAEAMSEELAALSGGKAPSGKAASGKAGKPAAPAAPDPAPDPEPISAGKAGAEPPAEEEFDLAEDRCYRIRFAPRPDFQTSGFDALKLFQALRGLGALQVKAEGAIPPLAELDPDVCPLSWELVLETDRGPDEVEHFFDIYRARAEIEVTAEDADDVDQAEPAPAADPVAANHPDAAQLAKPGESGAPPANGQGAHAQTKAPRTLRVDLERVDRLVNMVGEIVITQATLAQTLSDHGAANLELGHAIDAMSRQTRELQESVMAIRAQPVKAVFSRMARLLRDLAQQLGKEVRAEILGEHTEVDTTVIEELAEPLIHMVRNAMDHGIETPDAREKAGKPRQGTVQIAAEHRGERVVISIADDGRGIDRDRVLAKAIECGVVEPGHSMTPEEIDQLIFHPGLTTTEAVSNVSGRGVGMDVVKRNINALGGRVHLENRPGQGTRVTVTLPLSLAVLDGMTIAVGDQRFVIPLGAVIEALTLGDARPRRLPSGAQVIVRRDEYLPLISVRRALGVNGIDVGTQETGEQLVVVVDADADVRMGLLVDELIGQRQVVLKSLEANYRGVPGVSGATILSDGRAALILDVAALKTLAAPGAAPFGADIPTTEYLQ